MIPECRTFAVAVRAAGRRLDGVAVPFNRETRIGYMREVVRPGAFTRWLADNPDVRALVDHDPTKLLARSKGGSLRLTESAESLAFSLDVPPTAIANDVLAMAEHNLLSGMSFAFTVPHGGETITGELRELTQLRLHEISVVTGGDPAYGGTSVHARSRPMPRRQAFAAWYRSMRP